MEHAFAALPEIRRRLALGEELVIFLDFDGTLSPIVENPSDASMSEETRRLVEACARRYRTSIVTGRSLADIRTRAAITGVDYAGNHGMEWLIGGIQGGRDLPEEAQEDLKDAAEALRAIAAPGIFLEDKGVSVALHYRAVPDADQASVAAAARAAAEPIAARGRLEVLEQKKLLEVRPRGWHKGHFVRNEMANAPAGAFAVYIGDDRTDEDAFEILDSGYPIMVGSAPRTAAKYFLADISEVDEFLRQLSSTEPKA